MSAFPEPKKHRKLVAIDIVETSVVDHPAHLVEGWAVMKASGTSPAAVHNHLVDARYLSSQEQESAAALYQTDFLKAGQSVPAGEGSSISMDTCGCLYLVTPDLAERAVSREFTDQLTKARDDSRGDQMLTPEQVAFLLEEK